MVDSISFDKSDNTEQFKQLSESWQAKGKNHIIVKHDTKAGGATTFKIQVASQGILSFFWKKSSERWKTIQPILQDHLQKADDTSLKNLLINEKANLLAIKVIANKPGKPDLTLLNRIVGIVNDATTPDGERIKLTQSLYNIMKSANWNFVNAKFDREFLKVLDYCKGKGDTLGKNWFNLIATKAAHGLSSGNPRANCLLSYCHKNGIGTKVDNHLAANYASCAAKQGHAEGQYMYGIHLADNKKDLHAELHAELHFYNAAQQKHPGAQYELGMLRLRLLADEEPRSGMDLGARKKAFAYIQESADQGYPAAQYEVARQHLSKTGWMLATKEQDIPKGLTWLELAAKNGSKEAQFKLAERYLIGDGVTEDKKKAREWFYKVAHEPVQTHVGKFDSKLYQTLQQKAQTKLQELKKNN